MKYGDIKGMNFRDLASKKKELLEDLFHGQIKNAGGELGDNLILRKSRRDLARVQTAFSVLRVQKKEKKEISSDPQSN